MAWNKKHVFQQNLDKNGYVCVNCIADEKSQFVTIYKVCNTN